jgi:hypothetical protein
MKQEIYIVTDIECDGPIPGEYSMISLASVAINKEGKILNEFYRNLKPLSGAKQHPETMAFWKKNPKAWKASTSNPQDPEKVMKEYDAWLKKFETKKTIPRFAASPATLDFMFVFWYLIKFNKKYEKEFFNTAPIMFSGLDIRTYAMALMKTTYAEAFDSKLPKRWTENTGKHTHKAIDDARSHGKKFIRMLQENTK